MPESPRASPSPATPPGLIDDRFRPFDQLILSPTEAALRGMAPGALTLQRLWPRAANLVELEYLDTSGRAVPGQWLGDSAKFAQVAQATAQVADHPAPPPWILPDRQILLQPGGVDRRLPELARLLLNRTAQLIVHRPERRAVVRLEREGHIGYAKIVRPERALALATVMQQIHQLAAAHFQTPVVAAVDEAHGIIYLAALPGQSLHTLLHPPDLVWAAHTAGQTLRQLHSLPAPPSTPIHGAEAEVAVLTQWLTRLRWLAPAAAEQFLPHYDQVCAKLLADGSSAVLLHRDFYDKQIFINPAGRTGVLDFDLLAVGEAALDLANALVHLELRALQGQYSRAAAADAIATFLAAYTPTVNVQQRLQSYADATRLRLAAVYSCRPYGVHYAPLLLTRIGSAIG